jgi:voltage-gated sodium channel
MYAKLAAAARKKKERERRKQRETEKIDGPVLTKKTIEEFYAELDPKGLLRRYVEFGTYCRTVIENEWFGLFMNIVIVTAGILVGVQTYPSLEHSPVIAALDTVILVLFTIEVVMKILSHPLKPWDFFIGTQWTWNWFDFLIVLLCMPFMPFGNAAAALRLLRVLRVLKLLSKNPQLAMILVGIGAGIKSASFISLLMFLVFYMYATFALMMFKQDPVHFGDYWKAFVTLYR